MYDEMSVLSTGRANNDTVMDSSIYNMITAEGLRGTLFENVGEGGVLCIGDDTPG